MADKNVRSFRTSMSGYNKSDVLSYIDKMNADYRVEVNRHTAVLAEKDKLIAELENKCGQLEEIQAQLDRTRTDAAEKTAEAEYKAEQLEKSEAVIASQAELIEDYRKKLEECTLRLEQCEREKSDAVKAAVPDDYTELAQKAKMYDGISAQLGEILIAANKSADSILSESSEKAALVTANAAAAAETVKALIFENVAKISADLQVSAHNISANYYEDVTVDLMDLRDTVATSLRDVSQRAEQLSAKTEYIKSQFDKELENALSRLDAELDKLSESLSAPKPENA